MKTLIDLTITTSSNLRAGYRLLEGERYLLNLLKGKRSTHLCCKTSAIGMRLASIVRGNYLNQSGNKKKGLEENIFGTCVKILS